MKNVIELTTPIGTTRYCYLTEPSTGEYDGEFGLYRCELILNKEDWEALQLEIKPHFEAFIQEESQKKGKAQKEAATPFKIDDDGNYYLKTKRKAAYKAKANALDVKQGKAEKIGEEIVLQANPTGMVDGKALPIKDNKPIIGAGSKVKLGLRVRFWNVAALGCGLTCEPISVQIIELAEVGSSESVTGFKAEESAYTHGGETYEFKEEPLVNAETKEEAKPLAADF